MVRLPGAGPRQPPAGVPYGQPAGAAFAPPAPEPAPSAPASAAFGNPPAGPAASLEDVDELLKQPPAYSQQNSPLDAPRFPRSARPATPGPGDFLPSAAVITGQPAAASTLPGLPTAAAPQGLPAPTPQGLAAPTAQGLSAPAAQGLSAPTAQGLPAPTAQGAAEQGHERRTGDRTTERRQAGVSGRAAHGLNPPRAVIRMLHVDDA